VIVLRLDERGTPARDGVEFGQRQLAPVPRPLLLVPAAEREQPLPGRQFRRAAAERAERVGPAAHAVEADLGLLGGPDEVVVIVDQPGDHRPAAQVDNLGRRPGPREDLRAGARGRHAIAVDRHRRRDREPLVNRDDLPVHQHAGCHGSFSGPVRRPW